MDISQELYDINKIRQLAVKLGLSLNTIDTHDTNNRSDVISVAYRTLRSWITSMENREEAYVVLGEALISIGLKEVASEILNFRE